MALTKIPSSLLDTSGGFDLQGNITLGANEEVQFGDASELKIFNDGTNSVLRSSDNLLIQRNTTPRSAITITDSTGEVALAYGGSTVFQTTSTGATVTGNLAVTGDLDITGNVNSYNVTDLDVTDKTITLGAGQIEANSGGSGIIIDGSGASILWDETNTEWDFNNNIKVSGSVESTNLHINNTSGQLKISRAGSSDNGIYWDRLGTQDAAIQVAANEHLNIDNNFGNPINLRIGVDASETTYLSVSTSGIDVTGDLTLQDTTPIIELQDTSGVANGSAFGVIRFKSSNNNLNSKIQAIQKNGTSSADLLFFTRTQGDGTNTDGGEERLRITSTGNVGIGTTSPGHKLEVITGGNQTNAVKVGSSTSENEKITLGHFNASITNGLASILTGSAFGGIIQGGENGKLILGIRDNDTTDSVDIVSGSGNYMTDNTYDKLVATFRADGKVGINVTNPSATLDVNGTIKLDGNYPTGSNNVALGDTALDSIVSGSSNTAIGQGSLTALTTGNYNVGVGRLTLSSVTTTSNNVAVGGVALQNNTGGSNTAVGDSALTANTSASNNTAVGASALLSNTTGAQNTAMGKQAGQAITTASHNTTIGYQSLANTTTGAENTALGSQALASSTTASYNTAVGRSALFAVTTGTQNTALGYGAGQGLTAASSFNVAIGDETLLTSGEKSNNTAIGSDAMRLTTTGYDNVAVGYFALYSNTTGYRNVAVGYGALDSNTTSANNVAVGYAALSSQTTGTQNVAIGAASMSNLTTSNYNVAVGQATLNATVTGHSNVAVGDNAMQFGTAQYENVAVGVNAGRNYAGRGAVSVGYQAGYSQTASSTVAIGEYAGYDMTTSDDSVYVGRLCGENVTTGYTNVMMGDRAGQLVTTGYANTLIGYKAGDNITSGYNHTMVGQNVQPAYASGSSGEIGLGGGLTTNGTGYFTVGVGTSKGYYLYGSTNGFTAGSDERLKEEITDSTVGLDFINDLRPRTFKWKKKKDIPVDMPQYEEGSEERHLRLEKVQLGMIAQEVKEAIDNHPELPAGFSGWTTDVEGTQCLDYVGFVQPLIKAVQELSAKCDSLQNEINVLKGG